MLNQLPKKLNKEPLLDAVFEIRFSALIPASSILPGIFFDKLDGEKDVSQLHVGDLPKQIRDSDPNLRFAPVTRILWKDFILLIGDRIIAVGCKMPYVGWEKFSKIIIQIVKIVGEIKEDMKGRFDIVISQNSFEHFNNPIGVLNIMKELLKPRGKIYITFGPPWYAPYGAHMHYFIQIPWVNILFSERSLMSARSKFRNDGATKFKEVEGGLNKMTVKKFNDIIDRNDLIIDYIKYDCVKGMNFLAKIPILNELFINNIRCILTKVN